MSGSNVLEVITRGRVLCDEQLPPPLDGPRSDSQLSLEPLPPEAPNYSSTSLLCEQLQNLSYQPPSEQGPQTTWTDGDCSEGIADHAHSTDPKLRKALEKMKRLDERLATLEKRERELKKQRSELEGEHTPVFPTQVLEEGEPLPQESSREERPADDGAPQKVDRTVEHMGTNFIKRNIELASDAGALVAMTESEKVRLEELVGGEDTEEGEESHTALALRPLDEGFCLQHEDSDRMISIDRELQAILPPDQWQVLSASAHINRIIPEDLSDQEEGSTHPTQSTITEFRVSRQDRERLKEINERLKLVQDSHLTLPLADTELRALLETCPTPHEQDQVT